MNIKIIVFKLHISNTIEYGIISFKQNMDQILFLKHVHKLYIFSCTIIFMIKKKKK